MTAQCRNRVLRLIMVYTRKGETRKHIHPYFSYSNSRNKKSANIVEKYEKVIA